MNPSLISERVMRPIAKRGSLGALALTRCDIDLFLYGTFDGLNPVFFMATVTERLVSCAPSLRPVIGTRVQ